VAGSEVAVSAPSGMVGTPGSAGSFRQGAAFAPPANERGSPPDRSSLDRYPIPASALRGSLVGTPAGCTGTSASW
jgi:hypothetical protein